jgi:hypothetical protein
MATERDYQQFQDRIEELRQQLIAQLAPQIAVNPQLADVIASRFDAMIEAVAENDSAIPPPPDNGLAQLVGVGAGASRVFGDTRIPQGVAPYDETVTSERISAVGDLYYIFQHEKLGLFRAVQKLQELFKAGAIRLSAGTGAYHLYQFDRREVLRYTQRDRFQAYRRAFGYGSIAVLPGSRPNTDFHGLFTHFINQVALFWRDKRISDVMRERAYDPSFGSIAIVRRAGLDLRNNLKYTSFGHLNVLRVEVMQLLDEAFRILGSPDVRNLFGADTAWDVIEDILVQHFNEKLETSPRQRMAVAGRDVLRWLAQRHILSGSRVQFESLLNGAAEPAEEWLTSAQSLSLAGRMPANRVLAQTRLGAPSTNGRRVTLPRRPVPVGGTR